MSRELNEIKKEADFIKRAIANGECTRAELEEIALNHITMAVTMCESIEGMRNDAEALRSLIDRCFRFVRKCTVLPRGTDAYNEMPKLYEDLKPYFRKQE